MSEAPPRYAPITVIGPSRRVYEIAHDPTRHAPYGCWTIRHRGEPIGRLLSHPGVDDCEAAYTRHTAQRAAEAAERLAARARSGYVKHGTPGQFTRITQPKTVRNGATRRPQ
jgi:hypothetical protein